MDEHIIFNEEKFKEAIERNVRDMKIRLARILEIINCAMPFEIAVLVYGIADSEKKELDYDKAYFYIDTEFTDIAGYENWFSERKSLYKNLCSEEEINIEIQLRDSQKQALTEPLTAKMQIMIIADCSTDKKFITLNSMNLKTRTTSPDKFIIKMNYKYKSFFHAVIQWFIKSHDKDLSSINQYNENIINIAGDAFLDEIVTGFAYELKGFSIMFGQKGIHNVLSQLSSLKYETSEAKSRILISPVGNFKNLNLDIVFADKILLSEYRKVRKLLEISREDLLLVSDSSYILGYVSMDTLNKIMKADADFLICNILGNQRWNVERRNFSRPEVDKQILIEKNNFIYQYPKDKRDLSVVIQSIKNAVSDEDKVDIDKIECIVRAAIENKHGTMIVFVEDANREINRLQDYAIAIEETDTPEFLVKNITNIDGAVVYDFNGKCHAIGVILDGEAKPIDRSSGTNAVTKIDISRGARHNSALKYFNTVKSECFIVIVSEDGDITSLP